jgi:sugar lactone lactonase YvrE
MHKKHKSNLRSVYHSLGMVVSAAAVVLMTTGAQGQNVFVSEYGTGNLYEFTPAGQRSIFAFWPPWSGPDGLAFDNSGNLFVAGSSPGNIYELTPDGQQSIFASGLYYGSGLAFDSAGNLFAADFSGNIYKFDPGRTKTLFASGLVNPQGLVFDKPGNLFVSSYTTGEIYKFTPGGTRTTFASGLSGPLGLAFNSFGDLLVAAEDSGEILRFTPEGTRTTFASGLLYPIGLDFDSVGNLFVSDLGRGNIYEFTPSGTRSTFATGLYYNTFLAIRPPDTIPPRVLAISATPDLLWPPNHRMVPVNVAVNAVDNRDPSPTAEITQVTCNEPQGRFAPDWAITGPLSVDLRAERLGRNNRIYTIYVDVTDSSGNKTTTNTTVTVPESRSGLH